MKTGKRIANAWMIAAVVLGFTVITNSAYADTILISPGTGASDDIKNGGFESGTGGGNRTFANIDDWFNYHPNGDAMTGSGAGGNPPFNRTGTHGGSVSRSQTGTSHPAVDTGHTIALGDQFSLTFWYRDHFQWTVNDTVTATLYSATGDIWSDTVTPTNAWQNFTANNIPAANIGETLFLRFQASALNVDQFSAIDDITLTVSPDSASFALAITPAIAPATGFDLAWESQAGKLYNLRTSTDLTTPIAEWDLVEGDIVATPPTNVENVDPADPRRFYAVEEFAAPPPPPLLSEDFESDIGGFTTSTDAGTAWEWGDPNSTGFGGTVSAGNNGSTNCWGTGIGNPGFYANPTTNSRLISPGIDLTTVAAAELNFAHAIDLDAGDSAVVRIFNTATGDEIVAGNFPLTITDPDTSEAPWVSSGPHALPVGASIRIEWILSGTGGATQDFMGWYIDDVIVTETTP